MKFYATYVTRRDALVKTWMFCFWFSTRNIALRVFGVEIGIEWTLPKLTGEQS